MGKVVIRRADSNGVLQERRANGYKGFVSLDSPTYLRQGAAQADRSVDPEIVVNGRRPEHAPRSGWQRLLNSVDDYLDTNLSGNNPHEQAVRRPESGHYYSNRSLIIPCAATDAQVADVARRFAAPGQPDHPIANGEEYNASVLGLSGPVKSTYYGSGDYGTSVISTLNTTRPGHPFHNGSVSRDWFRSADGKTWVETVGRGVNSGASLAGANQLTGAPIFEIVDALAADYADKNICHRKTMKTREEK